MLWCTSIEAITKSKSVIKVFYMSKKSRVQSSRLVNSSKDKMIISQSRGVKLVNMSMLSWRAKVVNIEKRRI